MSGPSDFEKARWDEMVSMLVRMSQCMSGDAEEIGDMLLRMEAPTNLRNWDELVRLSQYMASGNLGGARDMLTQMGDRPAYPELFHEKWDEQIRKMLRKAKRDDSADLMIPEIGLKLVPFIVAKKLRDAVTGDLTEDFRTFAAR